MILLSLLAVSPLLMSSVSAAQADLVGTWTTKSAKVLTGPGFYNPVNDSFIEPSHTGISYSFTADGFYESAYYRAISNPTTPSCPKAILQFQHGTYTLPPNGSLLLTPFSVDSRQQLSDPCASSHSQYTRYSQFELFQQYDTTIDAYKKVRRLTLYQFDGAPLQPLYLAYSPPLMLPTVTMNPTPVATATGAAATARVRARRAEEGEGPMNRGARHIKRHDGTGEKKGLDVEDLVWWVGLGMTVLGGAVYLS